MTATTGRLTRAIRWNRTRCKRLERRLGYATPRLQGVYTQTVAALVNARPGQTVVDLGAGRASSFTAALDPGARAEVVGVDVAAEELRANDDVDTKVVIEPGAPLPFADGSVDLLVSRSVIEHIDGVPQVVDEIHRVLTPGGHTVHVFPSKHAPFSLLNRVLPRRASAWLLRTFIPGSVGRLGFPAHYDHCTASAAERLLRERGLEVVDVRVSYFQSDYFGFLVPLFLLSVAYESLVRALGLRDLAATVLVVARKAHDA
jgi:ubiquinone/menaquinone biosynthesis C-methylase UbiE